MGEVTLSDIFDDLGEKLQFKALVNHNLDVKLRCAELVSPADLVGHLNFLHPSRIQVVGIEEICNMQLWAHEKRSARFQKLLSSGAPVIIFSEEVAALEDLLALGEVQGVPMWSSCLSAAKIIDTLRSYLSRKFARTVLMHGVFMDVLGAGVLIIGDSGVGKSELALELISRGHGLVADDSVEISAVADNVLIGRAPEMLKNYLEVRGLGILNIRTIFGETAVRPKMRLNLVIYLYKYSRKKPIPRLDFSNPQYEILGGVVRYTQLPVAVGRNLAVLVEAAVRKSILELRGIDCTAELVCRQKELLQVQEKDEES